MDLRVLGGEVLREPLDQVDRAMLAAGATDRDREIAAVRAGQLGNPVLEEADDVGEHLGDDRMALEVFDDRRIAAGERGEARLPVGIGQAAHVEHEVGVARHAVPVREGLEQDRHAAFAAAADALADELAQLVHRGARGVDDQVGGVGDRLQQLALLAQRLRQAEPFAAQRMPPARLAIALEQRFLVGAQEQHLAVHAALLELRDQSRHRGDLGGAVAGIDADGGVAVGRLVRAHRVRDEHRQQPGRNVVDAVVVQVFEHVQRHALAGAGQTADDDEAHAKRIADSLLPVPRARQNPHEPAPRRGRRLPDAAGRSQDGRGFCASIAW